MATPINITFTAGTLTPGQQYTPQEYFEAITERLFGTLDADTLMAGVVSSSAPTVNKGIWLNTSTTPESIYTWDASLGKYAKESSQTPVGAVLFWPGTSSIPLGFAVCDGSSFNKADFPKCYAALGGSGSPYGQTSTTFQVPDYRGMTLFGTKDAWSIGDKVGAESVELEPLNLPDHPHDLRGYRNVDGAGLPSRVIIDDGRSNSQIYDNTAISGGGNGTDKGDPFPIIPPAGVGRWIIRME